MLTKEKLFAHYKSNILLGPLNGTLVLGFCYYVSGPMALQNLVTQGALVIKIEGKPLGDPSRHVFSDGMFNSMSHNQLSIAIDYHNEDDQKLLINLLQITDVIIDNRSVRAKKNDMILQTHLQNPQKLQPQIYCSINGYPNAETYDAPGLDASIQAATGLAYTNCSSPSNPLKIGIPLLDQVAGLLAAHYVVSNLYFLLKLPSLHDEEKKLIFISVSMAGVSIWLQTGQVINALEGEEFQRSGNQDQFAVPFSYYTTQNGLISIATVNEGQFKRFCFEVLQDEHFHMKYSTFKERFDKQNEFEHDLNTKLKEKTKEYWCELCRKFTIPASPVLTVSESVKQDFIDNLLSTSADAKPIVTHGTEHSIFPNHTKPAPAPCLDQDRSILFQLYSEDGMTHL